MVRRRSTKAAAPSVNAAKNVPIAKMGRKTYEEPESSSSNEFEQGSSQDGLSDAGENDDDSEEEMDDADADAPRFARWEDDDDLDYDQKVEEEEDSRLVKPKASKLVCSLALYCLHVSQCLSQSDLENSTSLTTVLSLRRL
jgi:hypothetical protein